MMSLYHGSAREWCARYAVPLVPTRGRIGRRSNVAHERTKLAALTAEGLSVQERILLFCLASDTAWQPAGVTEKTVLNMVIKGLVEREAGAHLSLTRQGRDALAALLDK